MPELRSFMALSSELSGGGTDWHMRNLDQLLSMKTTILCLALSIVSFAVLGAETNRVRLQATLSAAPPPKAPPVAVYQTNQASKLSRGTLAYSGVLPQIQRASNPLQLINPFAPMSYGDGYANATRDFHRQRIAFAR